MYTIMLLRTRTNTHCLMGLSLPYSWPQSRTASARRVHSEACSAVCLACVSCRGRAHPFCVRQPQTDTSDVITTQTTCCHIRPASKPPPSALSCFANDPDAVAIGAGRLPDVCVRVLSSQLMARPRDQHTSRARQLLRSCLHRHVLQGAGVQNRSGLLGCGQGGRCLLQIKACSQIWIRAWVQV
jgi:hypothetical protein